MMRRFTRQAVFVGVICVAVGGGAVWAYYESAVVPQLERKASRAGAPPPQMQIRRAGAPAKPAAPAADKFANWPTYTNTQHDFRFKFPPGWCVTDDPQHGEVMITNFEYPAAEGRGLQWPETQRMISVLDNPKRLSPQAFYRSQKQPEQTVVGKRAMKIAGVDAVKLEVEEEEWGVSLVVLIPRDDKMIELVSFENQEYLDEMLATFEFLW